MSKEAHVRESQFDPPTAEAGGRRPKTVVDLLLNYSAEEIKARLSWWLADGPAGKDLL